LPINKLEIIPIPVSTDVKFDEDIVNLTLRSIKNINSLELVDKDILVIAQKIISKKEGRFVNLRNITPSKKALEINKLVKKDPRLIELILQESKQIIKIFNNTIIVETNKDMCVLTLE
jgi:coenzyme F420-0:L-glutamate ligase/coenzyme F420-1:gamma-L-glutamate ligase